jgi:hypothetical protein
MRDVAGRSTARIDAAEDLGSFAEKKSLAFSLVFLGSEAALRRCGKHAPTPPR